MDNKIIYIKNNILISENYDIKSNPLKSVKAVYSDFIDSLKKDIEFKLKLKEDIKKQYNNRIQNIKKSRLSDIDKSETIKNLEINLNNELTYIDNQIEILIKEQQNKSSIYLIREKNKQYIKRKLLPVASKLELNKSIDNIINAQIKLIKNNTKIVSSDKKQLIINLISITSVLLSRINLKNYKIDNLLSEVEKEIDNVFHNNISNSEILLLSLKNKINIISSKISIKERNTTKILDILKFFEILVTTSEVILTILETFISFLPDIIGGNKLNKIQNIISFIQSIIVYISTFLSSIKLITDSLLNNIQYQKNRLYNIFSLFETSLTSGGLSNNGFDILLKNNSNLGYLDNLDYKGFKFYLKEENNNNFIIHGYKRRYAVAVNYLGKEILQSDYSFTLEPEVLVEQIKVEIDLKGLIP